MIVHCDQQSIIDHLILARAVTFDPNNTIANYFHSKFIGTSDIMKSKLSN